MSKYNILLKVANQFESLCKNAGILEDMAQRVFYSLTPSLVPDYERNVMGTPREPFKFMQARRHLVPGMKNLCKAVYKECYSEIEEHYVDKSTDNSEISKRVRRGKVASLTSLYVTNKVEEALKLMIDIYTDPSWGASWGGNSWRMIAKNTLSLLESIKSVESIQAKEKEALSKREDIEELLNEERKYLDIMIMYANIIDGISHNSGPIMKNLVSTETANNQAYSGQYPERYDAIERLMHSKELANWESVRDEVLPYIVGHGKPQLKHDGLRDFVDVAIRERNSTHVSNRDKEITLIRFKKELIGEKESIATVKQSINSVLNEVNLLREDEITSRIASGYEYGNDKRFNEAIKSIFDKLDSCLIHIRLINTYIHHVYNVDKISKIIDKNANDEILTIINSVNNIVDLLRIDIDKLMNYKHDRYIREPIWNYQTPKYCLKEIIKTYAGVLDLLSKLVIMLEAMTVGQNPQGKLEDKLNESPEA